MTIRRGFRRLSVVLITIWECVTIFASAWELWLWPNDPFRGVGTPVNYPDTIQWAGVWAILALLGIAFAGTIRWVVRGFIDA